MTPSHRSEPPPPRVLRDSWLLRLARARRIRLRTYRDRGLGWRLVAPAVFVFGGVLFVTSAVSSDGTDLRAGRYGDLGSVVSQQKKETDALRAEAAALAAEIEELSAGVKDSSVEQVQERVDQLKRPAGLQAVRGPGLTITLDDAPDEIVEAADPEDFNKLVVHQQDIQAVANAMWAGGAEAMTIQGQRVISTTGIKCVGNTVVLHGVPYSPPYVITAIGDPVEMLSAVNASPYIEIYLQYVESEDYQLGWDVDPLSEVLLPAYEGSLDLDFARPAGNTGSGAEDSDV